MIQFGPITVNGNSQRAVFLRDIYLNAYGFDYLPVAFRGIGHFRTFDAAESLAIMTFRTRQNARGELLLTAPVPVEQQAASLPASDLYMPLWARSNSVTTEWIVFASQTNQRAAGSLRILTNLGLSFDWK